MINIVAFQERVFQNKLIAYFSKSNLRHDQSRTFARLLKQKGSKEEIIKDIFNNFGTEDNKAVVDSIKSQEFESILRGHAQKIRLIESPIFQELQWIRQRLTKDTFLLNLQQQQSFDSKAHGKQQVYELYLLDSHFLKEKKKELTQIFRPIDKELSSFIDSILFQRPIQKMLKAFEPMLDTSQFQNLSKLANSARVKEIRDDLSERKRDIQQRKESLKKASIQLKELVREITTNTDCLIEAVLFQRQKEYLQQLRDIICANQYKKIKTILNSQAVKEIKDNLQKKTIKLKQKELIELRQLIKAKDQLLQQKEKAIVGLQELLHNKRQQIQPKDIDSIKYDQPDQIQLQKIQPSAYTKQKLQSNQLERNKFNRGKVYNKYSDSNIQGYQSEDQRNVMKKIDSDSKKPRKVIKPPKKIEIIKFSNSESDNSQVSFCLKKSTQSLDSQISKITQKWLQLYYSPNNTIFLHYREYGKFNKLLFQNTCCLIKYISRQFNLKYVAKHFCCSKTSTDIFHVKVELGDEVTFANKGMIGEQLRVLRWIQTLGPIHVLRWIADIASGICELEKLGIYHADLYFRNTIKVSQEKGFCFKIIDFDKAFKVHQTDKRDEGYQCTRDIFDFWLKFRFAGKRSKAPIYDFHSSSESSKADHNPTKQRILSNTCLWERISPWLSRCCPQSNEKSSSEV